MEPFPENPSGLPGPGTSAAAREQVSAPAILLMVTAGLGVVMSLVGLAQYALGSGQAYSEMFADPSLAPYRPLLERAQSVGGFSNVIVLLLSGLTFFGALKMKNLENFNLSMAAAIIALLPCVGPCCCLGLPVGIWSLVVLNKPEVKAAFKP
jgi:hypothetical protein